MTLLRNDSPFVDVNGTTATIDLLPVAVEGLRVLQEQGILPASVVLPDVSDPAGRDAAIATLESRLGRDLPDDFALIQVADANRLATAQSAVRAFDIVTVVLVVLAVVFIAATILLSGRRLRMAALLADRHRRLARSSHGCSSVPRSRASSGRWRPATAPRPGRSSRTSSRTSRPGRGSS